jgi:hypothetical protein
MKEIISDSNMVAFCGLYCGACRRYLTDKCPGCRENERARWCKVRSCCIEKEFSTCADCKEYSQPNDCKYFHNFISMIFGFIFRSNRSACIQKINEIGLQAYADFMTGERRQSLRR